MAGGKKSETKKVDRKKFSRRDFVVGSGAAFAGGALSSVAPATAKKE